jgi:hypothetical protein
MTNLIKLKEPVEVLAIFTKRGPQPYALKWAKKKFIIEKINLIYETKTGNSKLVYFSVTSQNNYFKLVFDTNNLKWHLEEIYHE